MNATFGTLERCDAGPRLAGVWLSVPALRQSYKDDLRILLEYIRDKLPTNHNKITLLQARLAQSVARKTLNLKAVSSSLTSGFKFFFKNSFCYQVPFYACLLKLAQP
jgi:hypothetical protein